MIRLILCTVFLSSLVQAQTCTDQVLQDFIGEPLKLIVMPVNKSAESIICLSKHLNPIVLILIVHPADNTSHTDAYDIKHVKVLGKEDFADHNVNDSEYSVGHMATLQEPGIYYIQCRSQWRLANLSSLTLLYSKVERIHIIPNDTVTSTSDVLTLSSPVDGQSRTTAEVYSDRSTAVITSSMSLSLEMMSSSLDILTSPTTTSNILISATQTSSTYSTHTTSLSTLSQTLSSNVPSSSITIIQRQIIEEQSSMLYYIIIGILSGISLLSVILNILFLLLLHYYKTLQKIPARKATSKKDDISKTDCQDEEIGYCNPNFDNNDINHRN